MQPPHLAAITHGKLSSHVWLKLSQPLPNLKSFGRYAGLLTPVLFNSSTYFAFEAFPGWLVRISLV
jgi:hypothetical protein